MKNRFVYLIAFVGLLWPGLLAFTFGQSVPMTPPDAPDQVQFADLTVRFEPNARRLVQQDINALMVNRQYWDAKLDRAQLYFPIIESVLLGEGIPTDFKYLALQESSLTPDAVSSSQAVGFWQFKRETAGDYGLQVNEEVDERKNITASTRAAARYLRRSNGMYNNWVSALFSFYLGTGGISQLVSPDWANAKDITLDGRTDRYILRFFAHKIAVEYAFKTHQSTATFSLIEYPNAGGKTIDGLAAELNINPADIRTYNRWLLIDHVPTSGNHVLTIPTPNSQINDLRQRIAKTSNQPLKNVASDDVGFPVLRKVTTNARSADDPILYEINGLPGIQAQAGDNPGSLASKAKISLSSFLRYNELTDRDLVTAGEVYYLAKKYKKALVPFHTARADESMRSISQRYGIRLKKLLKYNRMDRVQKLQVGRVLWLREKRPSKTPVEIINGPTPPVYDPTPATPSTTQTQPVASNGQIPRNASERRRYQPKLVGNATPSATPVDQPATEVATTTKPTTSAPRTATPTPILTAPPMAADVPSSQPAEVTLPRSDAGSPQRTIIVRSEGEPLRERTTPARTDVNRPTNSGTTESVATTPPKRRPADPDRSVPTTSQAGNVPDEPTSRPKPTSYPETPDPELSRTAQTRPRQAAPQPSPQVSPTTAIGERDATSTRNREGSVPPLPPMTKPRTEAAPSSGGRTMTHTVEAGQTYYSISKYYGVTVDELLDANSLSLDNKLSVGQKLSVRNVQPGYPVGQPVTVTPPRSTTTTTEEPEAPVTPPAGPTYHVVAKGETLYSISRQYSVTVEQLVEWNKLPDMNARLGQKLKVSE
ncbi:LysM peptidoglycan-binding domain-containing protein [Fibrella sp. WM1]|uniref:LysM peptidoglycan-binding domain-containing protein n=1 Tax=Fibrella musci TaxID=3242485 RepID=UPI0035213FAD